jgi:ATP-dependent RNA helicase RhlE
LSFNDFSFEPSLEEALSAMGFEEPTPIQQQAIPLILQNRDLIACAQTGTGKTAAFVLPVLNKLASNPNRKSQINTLIIAPTRELAQQIDQQIEGFAYFTGVSSIPVYGGGDSSSWDQQKKALKNGADIIIATPGRLISHIQLGYVDLSHIEHFILDEADRMLDMGFYDDIMQIFNKTPKQKQCLLFSATMPTKIRQLAGKILNNPEQISLSISKPAEGVLQGAYLTYDEQKIPLIQNLLIGKQDQYQSVIIFSSTKRMVKEIMMALNKGNLKALMISSDLEQEERESALQSFKSKETQILVATDILARGIDIKEISLVINYDVPHDAEDYVHRVGRTARADSTGVAITFVNPREASKFHAIEKFLGEEIKKIPLPTELGEAPAYEPGKRFARTSGAGGGRGRGGNSGGSNNRGPRNNSGSNSSNRDGGSNRSSSRGRSSNNKKTNAPGGQNRNHGAPKGPGDKRDS